MITGRLTPAPLTMVDLPAPPPEPGFLFSPPEDPTGPEPLPSPLLAAPEPPEATCFCLPTGLFGAISFLLFTQ